MVVDTLFIATFTCAALAAKVQAAAAVSKSVEKVLLIIVMSFVILLRILFRF
jgi:hypothetical protein